MTTTHTTPDKYTWIQAHYRRGIASDLRSARAFLELIDKGNAYSLISLGMWLEKAEQSAFSISQTYENYEFREATIEQTLRCVSMLREQAYTRFHRALAKRSR